MSDTFPKPPPSPVASGKPRSFALKFISGKYQGGEFPLTPNKQIVVGRSSDLEMVLVEDMVSRRHARIFWEGDQVLIEDLGSTNGTFVNGERVRKQPLKEGDRVLVGTSILKMIVVDAAVQPDRSKPDLETVAAQRRTTQVRTMAGSIEEIPLPDLLQLLATSKKTGTLVIRTEDDVGRIYMRKGTIYYAVINELDEVPPIKSIFRLLTWQKGLFELEALDEKPVPEELDISVPELLMEGLRQIDEFNALRDKLPDLRTKLKIPKPLTLPLKGLSPEELDTFQIALNWCPADVETILNKSPLMDLETAQVLVQLLSKKYIVEG